MAQDTSPAKGLIMPVVVSTLLIVGFATFARTRMSGQYGAGRRRTYWAREGGLIPEGGVASMMRRR